MRVALAAIVVGLLGCFTGVELGAAAGKIDRGVNIDSKVHRNAIPSVRVLCQPPVVAPLYFVTNTNKQCKIEYWCSCIKKPGDIVYPILVYCHSYYVGSGIHWKYYMPHLRREFVGPEVQFLQNGHQGIFINDTGSFRMVYVAWNDNFKECPNRSGRGLSNVLNDDFNYDHSPIIGNTGWMTETNTIYRKPRPLGGDYAFAADPIGLRRVLGHLPGQPQSVKQSYTTNDGESKLPPCNYYLPLTGRGTPFASGSGALLGVQVVSLVLVGAGFSFFSAIGFAWVFNQPDRNRKLAGVGLSLGCLIMTLFFYGWGFFGNPWAVLGMCSRTAY